MARVAGQQALVIRKAAPCPPGSRQDRPRDALGTPGRRLEYQQGAAHDGLAHAHEADSDLDSARSHWRHALALYTELDVPEANEVLSNLALPDLVLADLPLAARSSPGGRGASRHLTPVTARSFVCPQPSPETLLAY